MKARIEESIKKGPLPAKLDFIQSATGLILGLFMWGHMLLVSSILLGKDTMYFVAKSLEGSFLTSDGHGFPILVSLAAAGISVIFIIHALVAIRKFPSSWKQFRIYRSHMNTIKHPDTNLWFTQVVTAFIMFFLGSIHLFVIMTHPSEIGPFASSDRIVSDWMWPLYLVLLFAVELHGTIGLYRLCVKWGWLEGKNSKVTRKRLKNLKRFLTIFFLVLGLATLGAYVKIGFEHRDHAGERYIPHTSRTINH